MNTILVRLPHTMKTRLEYFAVGEATIASSCKLRLTRPFDVNSIYSATGCLPGTISGNSTARVCPTIRSWYTAFNVGAANTARWCSTTNTCSTILVDDKGTRRDITCPYGIVMCLYKQRSKSTLSWMYSTARTSIARTQHNTAEQNTTQHNTT